MIDWRTEWGLSLAISSLLWLSKIIQYIKNIVRTEKTERETERERQRETERERQRERDRERQRETERQRKAERECEREREKCWNERERQKEKESLNTGEKLRYFCRTAFRILNIKPGFYAQSINSQLKQGGCKAGTGKGISIPSNEIVLM